MEISGITADIGKVFLDCGGQGQEKNLHSNLDLYPKIISSY